jgi:hypothetical protein
VPLVEVYIDTNTMAGLAGGRWGGGGASRTLMTDTGGRTLFSKLSPARIAVLYMDARVDRDRQPIARHMDVQRFRRRHNDH